LNLERLLREVERRLSGLAPEVRDEVLDALREETGRERRRLDPGTTVEVERERRMEAEILREVLEAIGHQAQIEDTSSEVLKQLARLVLFDEGLLGLHSGDGQFRVVASRGEEGAGAAPGTMIRNSLTDALLQKVWPLQVQDLLAEPDLAPSPGIEGLRSWCGVPLVIEGRVLGVLCLGRNMVAPFDEADLHRLRAVAFSAAAAIQKVQLIEQVRHYAALLEQVLTVDQKAFAGATPAEVARSIVEGAAHIGHYPAGLLLVADPSGPWVAAAWGEAVSGVAGEPAPSELLADVLRRLTPLVAAPLWRRLGVSPPEAPVLLVPFNGAEGRLGTLVLLDPDGESPDDRLLEAYASRSAAAYAHAQRRG
jgi:hypothetical protein